MGWRGPAVLVVSEIFSTMNYNDQPVMMDPSHPRKAYR